LAEVTPSRWDDGALARMQAALAGLGEVHGVALELAVADGRARLGVRATTEAVLARMLDALYAHHPQMHARPLDLSIRPDTDPLHCGAGESRVCLRLGLARPSAFPLRVPVPAARGSGPRPGPAEDAGVLADVLTAAAHAHPGQRVVLQVVLGPAPPPGAPAWPPGSTMAVAPNPRPGPGRLRARTSCPCWPCSPWVDWGCGATCGTATATSCRWPPSALLREKLATTPFAVQVRLTALGASTPDILAALARRVAMATSALDHPAGNSLRARQLRGDPRDLTPSRDMLRRADILTTAEIAALWHLAPALGPSAPAERARHLLPATEAFRRGGRVGVASHQGTCRPIHLPPSLLARHHLVVARTRRGKSTLLLHLARTALERLATGGERLALVVIDPHQDLAEAVLGLVPAGLEEGVVYLNLADRERPVGLNLLDPDLFPDRDRAAEHLVTMLHRLWPDNWGPRMEGALRAALMALYEANQTRPPEHRYTLLDVTPFLATHGFREEVLAQVRDLALHAWWNETYTLLPRVLQQQIATPITTKIGRFLVGEAARLVIGQARSTLDPRRLLAEGGALVVNAAAGRLGEGGAALLGATVLNLVGLLVEEQVATAPERRPRVVALVDEASTLVAADYPRMLSEYGKYGLAVVLVTQSLAKLDAIDRHLRPTVLANVDALTVFGVSAEDARLLAPELGPELAPEDLTDLDDYTCYARWWADSRRPAAFSSRVDPPSPPDRRRVSEIAARSAARVGLPREAVLREIETVLRERRDGRMPLTPQPTAGSDDDAAVHGGPERVAAAGPRPLAPVDQATPPVSQTGLWGEPVPSPPTRRRSHARSNAVRRDR
jgi:hypothetical protein